MAARLDVPAAVLNRLLTAREEESSTVIAPHIIVAGAKPFEMLLARCGAGIRFGEDAPDVRAVIVLAGSKRERHFHLRCLAAIAQVVQAVDFESRWMAARTEQGLRDIFLLGARHRRREPLGHAAED